MAFPATGGSVEQLSSALNEARALARKVKLESQSLRDQSAAGDVGARGIVLYMDDLQRANDRFEVLRQVPGIVQYARDQYDNQSIDIGAEFLSMQGAIVNTIGWINTNIPKDVSDWLLVESIVANRLTSRMLTSAQTAALRTELDALIATID